MKTAHAVGISLLFSAFFFAPLVVPNHSGVSSRSGSTASITSARRQTTIGDASKQMRMAHDAKPNGVSAEYPWAEAPDITMPTPPLDVQAVTGWGAIQFAAGAPTPVAGAAAHLRNFKTYLLTSSNQLTLIQDPDSLGGAQQYPDFHDDIQWPAQMTNSKGVTTVILDPTKAFQFWPPTRASLNPVSAKGIVVTVEARISAPEGAADSNINNSYILALGADWWVSMDASWDNNTTNPGVGDGRYVFLKTSWQCITFTSITDQSAAVATTPFDC